jgi:hypothetical protein
MVPAVFRSVTESELAFIAGLDYGQDAPRHLEALRVVCFSQEGIVSSEQQWFPYEVIELGSHSLRPGHEREFAICTLLVLANVAAGVDTSTDVQGKFGDRAADYDRLSTELREEILNAYKRAEG